MVYRPHARAELVAGLVGAGGSVVNDTGRAALELSRQVALHTGRIRKVGAVTELAGAMERDGQLHRVTRGTRTFQLTLAAVPAGLLDEARQLMEANGTAPDMVADLIVAAGYPASVEPGTVDESPQVQVPSRTVGVEQLPALVQDLVDTVGRQQRLIDHLAARNLELGGGALPAGDDGDGDG